MDMCHNPFVGLWKINEWISGPFPATAFEAGTTVVKIEGAGDLQGFNVFWQDQKCSMTGLSFHEENAELRAPAQSVDFGELGTIVCFASFSLEPCEIPESRRIRCYLSLKLLGDGNTGIPGDGNTGTFAADAHPGIDGSA